jgi:hypothetical protein
VSVLSAIITFRGENGRTHDDTSIAGFCSREMTGIDGFGQSLFLTYTTKFFTCICSSSSSSSSSSSTSFKRGRGRERGRGGESAVVLVRVHCAGAV